MHCAGLFWVQLIQTLGIRVNCHTNLLHSIWVHTKPYILNQGSQWCRQIEIPHELYIYRLLYLYIIHLQYNLTRKYQITKVEECWKWKHVLLLHSFISIWACGQKVHPLNPGMFVYSYLFSSYYSYTKLWLLLFSMHWWVVKVKIGSFGHQEED